MDLSFVLLQARVTLKIRLDVLVVKRDVQFLEIIHLHLEHLTGVFTKDLSCVADQFVLSFERSGSHLLIVLVQNTALVELHPTDSLLRPILQHSGN